MNRSEKLIEYKETSCDIDGFFKGGRIKIDYDNAIVTIDLTIKNINLGSEDNHKYAYIKDAITIQDNDVDYKDIEVLGWNAEECLSSEAVHIISSCLSLLPKVITGKLLRFVNIYQYNIWLSGKKGYDRVANKYMTLEMARKIYENGGATPIPQDLLDIIMNSEERSLNMEDD